MCDINMVLLMCGVYLAGIGAINGEMQMWGKQVWEYRYEEYKCGKYRCRIYRYEGFRCGDTSVVNTDVRKQV